MFGCLEAVYLAKIDGGTTVRLIEPSSGFAGLTVSLYLACLMTSTTVKVSPFTIQSPYRDSHRYLQRQKQRRDTSGQKKKGKDIAEPPRRGLLLLLLELKMKTTKGGRDTRQDLTRNPRLS
jgi:hypothetical protein